MAHVEGHVSAWGKLLIGDTPTAHARRGHSPNNSRTLADYLLTLFVSQ